jgi:hypothetical protein
MATVYLAEDLRHHRKVALKVLRPELAAAMGADRFAREIEVAARLVHPHILGLIDSGDIEGFFYYVMPYVEGETLRDRLTRSGELPVHEAVRLLSEIADALSVAHKAGVVHRDIKPENILLSGRHAMVMDFGVAKAVTEASGRQQLTTAGVVLGTPAYMAPEQATADPHLDGRVDIYALGVLGYEMLTGYPPFHGITPQQTLAAHVTQVPTAVGLRRPGLSPALESVVMRCLAKRPADRFQSAEELVAVLEPLATPGGGITPIHTQPIQATARPRRLALGVGAAVLVVLAVAAIGGFLALRRPVAVSPSHAVRQRITTSGRAWNPVVSPDGAFVLYQERQPCPSDPWCPNDVILQETGLNGARRVLSSVSTAVQLAGWSPDGRRFLMQRLDNGRPRMTVVSMLGGELVHEVGAFAAWSPYPDTLLSWELRGAALRIMLADDGGVVDSVVIPNARNINGASMSPDGRWIAVTYFPNEMFASPAEIVMSRHGEVADSLPGEGSVVGWSRNPLAVYLLRERSDQSEIVRQPLDPATGRRHGNGIMVTRIASADVWIADTNAAVTERGVSQGELWALERSRVGARWNAQRLYRATVPIRGGISRAGDFITMTLLANDSVTEWLEVPFGGGAPRASRLPLRYLRAMAADANDSETVFVIGERQAGTTRLKLLSMPAGSVVDIGPAPSDSGWVWMLPGQRYLWQAQEGQFTVLDSAGRFVRHIAWPDSLGSAGIWLLQDRHAAFVYSVTNPAGAIKIDFYVLNIDNGAIRHLTNVAIGNYFEWGCASHGRSFGVIREDSVSGWHDIDIDLVTGRASDLGALPVQGENIRFLCSAGGLRASLSLIHTSTDIVLLRGFDPWAGRARR